MAASAIQIRAPEAIQTFFQTLYAADPEVIENEESPICFLPEKSISITFDRFRGCHIKVLHPIDCDIPTAKKAIQQLADTFIQTQSCRSLWIDTKTPVQANLLFAIAPDTFEIGNRNKGDLIYDANRKTIHLYTWLNPNEPCPIPPGATHNLGTSSAVINKKTGEVLLVEDEGRYGVWSFPGGSYELNADANASAAAKRETKEETGFDIDEANCSESSLVSVMEIASTYFAPGVNLVFTYFVNPETPPELTPQPGEIRRAQWVKIKQIFNQKKFEGMSFSPEVRPAIYAAMQELGFNPQSARRNLTLFSPSAGVSPSL